MAGAVRPLRISLGVGGHTLIKGEEDPEVSHPKGDIVYTPDGLRELRTHLQDMRLRRAEDRDGAVRLPWVGMQIGIMLRTLIVEAEDSAQILHP